MNDDSMFTQRELILNLNEDYQENCFIANSPEIDPDTNFYNQIKPCSSNYITAEEIDVKLAHSDQSFGLLHINCRSMLNKVADINVLLTTVQPTVLALTETWLQEDATSCINIPGYTFVHRCRPDWKGGGVGFLIRNDCVFHELENCGAEAKNGIYESLFVKIKQMTGKDLMVGNIYRPQGMTLCSLTMSLTHCYRVYLA